MPDSDTPHVLFSEVLGAMVSSIAQARQIADVAAVNLAYTYQRHDLLRGMAVPRLRFRSVDVSLPVLIQQVRPAQTPELDEAAAIAQRVAAEVQRRAELVAQKLRFDVKEESSTEKRTFMMATEGLWKKIKDKIESENTPPRPRLSLHARVTSQLERRIMRYFAIGDGAPASVSESAIRAEVEAAVRSGIRRFIRDTLEDKSGEPPTPPEGFQLKFSEFQRTPQCAKVLAAAAQLAADTCFRTPSVPAELEMIVCTDDIKNKGGGPDSVTRIRFTLLEEGLEWVEDEQGRRLTLE